MGDDTTITDESNLQYGGAGLGPVYVDVGSAGLNRPNVGAGTKFGLQFDGADTLNGATSLNVAGPGNSTNR